MQVISPSPKPEVYRGIPVGPVITALVAAGFLYYSFSPLWKTWRSDPTYSHGALVPLAAFALIWARRGEMEEWTAADSRGLALMAGAAAAYVAAVWADIEFARGFSVIGILLGGVWFLGGIANLKVCSAGIGMLSFMIPWPTLLTERIAFPLQLLSSAYTVMLGGLLGLPLVRDGVNIQVVPDPAAAPVYSMMVARQCSGITSLVVLLALGYLITLFTPLGFGWRSFLLACVIPLALFANIVRLTVILVFGTYTSDRAATWVHNNETPVLIFFCSLGLLGIRAGIIKLASMKLVGEQSAAVSIAHS